MKYTSLKCIRSHNALWLLRSIDSASTSFALPFLFNHPLFLSSLYVFFSSPWRNIACILFFPSCTSKESRTEDIVSSTHKRESERGWERKSWRKKDRHGVLHNTSMLALQVYESFNLSSHTLTTRMIEIAPDGNSSLHLFPSIQWTW